MLGAVKKSQTPTAEELQQCQKHAKVRVGLVVVSLSQTNG